MCVDLASTWRRPGIDLASTWRRPGVDRPRPVRHPDLNLGTLVPRTNALSIRPQGQPCIFLWSVSSGCLGACQFSTPKREKSRQIPDLVRARHGKGLPRNPLRLFKSTHAGQRFGDVARWILREFRGLEGSASQTHHKMHGSARVLWRLLCFSIRCRGYYENHTKMMKYYKNSSPLCDCMSDTWCKWTHSSLPS